MNNEFFSLPLFPPATLCDDENYQGTAATCGCNCGSTNTNCGNCSGRTSGCGCNR